MDDMALDSGSMVEGSNGASNRICINVSFIFVVWGKKKMGIDNFAFNFRGIGTQPPGRVGCFNGYTFNSDFGVDKFDQLK